jgi:hypothetical protein
MSPVLDKKVHPKLHPESTCQDQSNKTRVIIASILYVVFFNVSFENQHTRTMPKTPLRGYFPLKSRPAMRHKLCCSGYITGMKLSINRSLESIKYMF